MLHYVSLSYVLLGLSSNLYSLSHRCYYHSLRNVTKLKCLFAIINHNPVTKKSKQPCQAAAWSKRSVGAFTTQNWRSSNLLCPWKVSQGPDNAGKSDNNATKGVTRPCSRLPIVLPRPPPALCIWTTSIVIGACSCCWCWWRLGCSCCCCCKWALLVLLYVWTGKCEKRFFSNSSLDWVQRWSAVDPGDLQRIVLGTR